VRVMMFNTTFNNISVISWRSVSLFVEETRVHWENHRPAVSRWQTVSHIMLYRVHLVWAGFKLTTLVVIGTDCIGSCKSNYHTITTTTASLIPKWWLTPSSLFYRTNIIHIRKFVARRLNILCIKLNILLVPGKHMQ
jgi:hypothetical protein